MTTVTLVALPDTLPSCLTSWEDLFRYAGRLSRRRGGPEIFAVDRWTPGAPVPDRPDVVLVPVRLPGGPLGTELEPTPADLKAVLRLWSAEGTVVGAVCAGVFCLADTGLLDGRRATTHWSLAAEFRRRFPRVTMDPDALVIEDEGFILGGGMTAYFDVGLRLIRRYAGPEVARDCADVFVLDPDRRHQGPFAPVGWGVDEADPVLARAMAWALGRTTLDFGVAEWAAAAAVEKRTLERRAQAAWGFGPAERLRRLRLDKARHLAAGGTLGWEEISARCGYRDPAAFRRLFLARFGQTPGEYRRRFGPSPVYSPPWHSSDSKTSTTPSAV